MATTLDLDQIVEILTSAVNNDSSVAGVSIADAINELQTNIPTAFNITDVVDPNINSNPTNVGDVWKNEDSGEIFVCTDNTTDLNVWVGTSGTLINPVFQGTDSGFVSTGFSTVFETGIDKFSFANDVSAGEVGDIAIAVSDPAGISSNTDGYVVGGDPVSGTNGQSIDDIQKFSMVSGGNGAIIGNLTTARRSPAGQSSSVAGYTTGGQLFNTTANTNVIDKFLFAGDAQATDVGDLTAIRDGVVGMTAVEFGYSAGGITTGSTRSNTIDKHSFVTDINATDVGDMTSARRSGSGNSSLDNGYFGGGDTSTGAITTIDKISFASDINAVSISNLSTLRTACVGVSSVNDAYTCGGTDGTTVSTIDKMNTTTEATAVDVSDLSVAKLNSGGHQI